MPERSLQPLEDWSGRRDSNPRPMPWQGIALSTELLPQSENDLLDRKLVLILFSVNAKLTVLMIQNYNSKPSVKKSLKKWAIISMLSLFFYFLGYFYSLSQYQPTKTEIIRNQPLALIYPG